MKTTKPILTCTLGPLGKLRDFLSRKSLYVMAIICLSFVVVFAYLPLLGWFIAFFNYKPGLKFSQMEFKGLDYFILALKQPDLLRVLKNTLVFSFLGLLASPIPVIFAIALSEMRFKKTSRMIQTVTTFPNFISWVLVFTIFFALFSAGDGAVNKFLLAMGYKGKPLNPIGNPNIAYSFQTGIGVWKGMGFNAIIYLAALSGIDPGLYEAAEIDGASRFQKIIHIKIPGLMPTFFTLLVLSIGQMLNNGFEQYLMFYNGLVGDKLEVLDYYVYRLGLLKTNYSIATAISMMKTVVSVALLYGANKLSKKVRGVSVL